ncbi:MAG: aconitate hydratase AcnA [Raoultibacter sp.]|jgi:aconitate hydratase
MTTQDESLQAQLQVGETEYTYYPVKSIEGAEELPYSLTVLLENALRNAPNEQSAREAAQRIVDAGRAGEVGSEIEYSPARVLLQDFTGVPVFVDFAVMREAMMDLGGDPAKVNPQIPCDLVIDHSVIAEEAGCKTAFAANQKLEYERNEERYTFLKWSQNSFENVRIVPPGMGICHQINVEEFAQVAMTSERDAAPVVYFDTVVGTDSHTTTANGIGVLSWGVGGIEAEAAALGQPITTLVPRVIGVELTGSLRPGVSAMDLALVFAQILREKGVVGAFVECYGPGLEALTATQRACIANMTPEYGCTCTLFPVDQQTLDYLTLTGRSEDQVALVEAYAKAQGFWNDPSVSRTYSEVITLDLSAVTRNISGPARPHDRIGFESAQDAFKKICDTRKLSLADKVEVEVGGSSNELTHGAIAIAAITSCTTATDPAMMIASGLIAKKAAEKNLKSKPWVKTILAPGSHATELLLEKAGLLDGLEALGFYNCGFGCMSCIGNSGPILPAMQKVSSEIELASVLSGNRNFEGRISPDVSQNYLAQPAIVVAYALAGTLDFDFENTALGFDAQGSEVYLRDIWPSDEEIATALTTYNTPEIFNEGRKTLYSGDEAWQAIEVSASDTFAWDKDSTYVRRAPYFEGMKKEPVAPKAIERARVLVNVGDFITTDHISPAGSIAADSPAARYLSERNVEPQDFNTYGARRGNHEVMMRGTFANVKLQNKLAEGRKGCWTYDFSSNELTSVFDASQSYAKDETPLVVLAGKMYGSGSSRDWAAKGPLLQGVRAVFAESFERIHRSNLIGMGILPLQFAEGENAEVLGLDGSEVFSIEECDFSAGLPNPSSVAVTAEKADGETIGFTALVRIDTPTEGHYYYNGGILQYVLRGLAKA